MAEETIRTFIGTMTTGIRIMVEITFIRMVLLTHIVTTVIGTSQGFTPMIQTGASLRSSRAIGTNWATGISRGRSNTLPLRQFVHHAPS
jgi:hypothetical protein